MPKEVFVDRYKWSHDKRRRVLRRAEKDGKVTLLYKNKGGFCYSVPDDFKKKLN